jgi:aspartate aminotransferase
MVGLLSAIPEVSCLEPDGAFYCFPDLSAYVGRRTSAGVLIDTDVALCEYLVDAGRVALVPGTGFGAPGHARLSYACSMDDIRTGLERLARALAELE